MKNTINVNTLRHSESQPEKAEIESTFSVGQFVIVEYDLPRKGHSWRGYASSNELAVRKALGLFEVTDIVRNMLVNPNFTMVELTLRDEKFGKIHPDSKTMLIDEDVVMKRWKVIDKSMIASGLEQGLVKLIDSPHGDGVVCSISDNWFYFDGMTAEECSAAEYKANVPFGDIVNRIHEVLSDFVSEFTDEYLYYYAYLREQLKEIEIENIVVKENTIDNMLVCATKKSETLDKESGVESEQVLE